VLKAALTGFLHTLIVIAITVGFGAWLWDLL
jgi:hypothetical protein